MGEPAVNPLRGIDAPLRCGTCKRVRFEAALEVSEGQARVVALVCACGAKIPVDANGFIPFTRRGGLTLMRGSHA